MTTELKPCPFCESPDVNVFGDKFNSSFKVGCNDCDAQGPYSEHREYAAQIWNARPLEHQARAEALEEARCAYEAHHHVAKSFLNPGAYPPDDSCAYCGLDLRNPVHLRHGEVKELRIRALKERQPEGEK